MNKALALMLVAAVASVSCNRGPASTSSGKPTVALVLKTLNHPFFVDMRRGAQEAADRLGVNLQVQAAEREIDVEKQMQIVENMIQTGIQALCITPSGSREIISALVKANAAKVPVVVIDTRLDKVAAAAAGVHTETFVGSDDYEGGKIAGEYLLKLTNGKAHVAVLEGNLWKIPQAIDIARHAMRLIDQNWQLILYPNTAAIGLSIVGWIGPVGATILSNGAGVLASLNALRPLLAAEPRSDQRGDEMLDREFRRRAKHDGTQPRTDGQGRVGGSRRLSQIAAGP